MKFNVLDFGAVSDGGLCTEQVQSAIDACFLQGGGEVIVPEGVFLVGGLRIRSNVTLHLLENAVLLGSTDPEDYLGFLEDALEPISEDLRTKPVSTVSSRGTVGRSAYPCSRWNNAVIRGIGAKNVEIIGEKGSKICGQNCFDPQGEEDYRGPHAINLWFCENVTLHGYTICDSANWAHAIQNSQNIHLRNVTVLGGHDGFDVRTCDNVLVEYCTFRTGDDCIAGFDNLNVTVRNCYFESACSIFRFGGTDVLIENCNGNAPSEYAFRGSMTMEERRNRLPTNENHRRNCLNVFLYYCDYRAEIRKTPGNITVRNSVFNNADAVLRLPFGHIWCCNRSLHDITFENCRFEGVCLPLRLDCPADEPLSLRMEGCTVTAREGFEGIEFLSGKNVALVELVHTDLQRFDDPKISCEPAAKIRILP